MAVDVVVVNYKTYDLLFDFCGSYDKYKFPGCTLTVVNVETGHSQISDWFSGDVVSIDIEANVGYGKACNLGARLGKNDVILLANADTLLSDGFEQCYNSLMLNPSWGILGPRQVNEVNQITAGGIIGTPQSPRQRGWNDQDRGQYSDIIEDCYSVSGSLYFIKRSVWKELTECPITQQYSPGQLGAFLETPHYFEETTCSRHALAHGYKSVFYGPVQMIHLWHRASGHGGWADRQFSASLQMHRDFCDLHGIIHE